MIAGLLAVAVWAWGMSIRPVHRHPTIATSTKVRRARRGTPGAADWARTLDDIAARVRGGTALRTAITDAGVHAGTPAPTGADGAVVTQVLTTAARLGGATAAIVQAGAAILRERAAARDEAMAHGAQARLSARVLTLVPLGFTLWSAAASTSFRHALATPAGAAALTIGLCCNLAGWCWMRRIVRRAAV